MNAFYEVFGREPEACADAPGRVNLLGEHTDYSEGFVLPTSIPQRTFAAVARSRSERSAVYSAQLGERAAFGLEEPPGQAFARYVFGCMRVLADTGVAVPHLDIHVRSEVPIGVGLSSSAALELAVLRALRTLLGLGLDDVALAQLGHLAENRYAGVQCGILDQMACSLLPRGAMLFLDTRSLERVLLPLPAGCEIAVIDSGVPRALASTAYNERRAQCEEAARLLGLRALRDARDVACIEALPEPLRRRARHVVTENGRALRAARGVDAATFGTLMSESHGSLRDDYEVSVPALDELVSLLLAEADVYGAKLTGAGFGGACVALCRSGTAASAARRVVERYNTPAREARLLVPSF